MKIETSILIIGGSAAGVTAAITARRNYPERKITLLRKERQVPIPCGIPYMFGTLASPDQNLIADELFAKNKVDLIVGEGLNLDVEARLVRTPDDEISFERLILATGSIPSIPPLAGKELKGVYHINKDMDFLRKLKESMHSARHVLVVGGGFIGVEFADEIMKNPGKKVTVVEIEDTCLSLSYDPEFCREMEMKMRDRGIAIHTSTRVEAICGTGRVSSVKLSTGEELEVDMVLLGTGSKANVELARKAGLEIGATGGIAVDRGMRTSVADIFACGDCTEKTSFFGGGVSQLKLASIATQEARIAGANLFETRLQGVGTLGAWSTMISGLAIATAGLTESAAKAMGYSVICAAVEGVNRHPASMPGSSSIKLKLVFEKTSGILLGGQAMGGESVGEMINIIVALVQKSMRADEIALFQMGTHPALTASPIAYPLVNAAQIACQALKA